jgi:glycosyltransferase involved in cell wall biosynthesis
VKVLFISSGTRENGISNLALSQANSLIALNVDVELFYIRDRGIIGYLKNILPLRKQIRIKKYDLVHAHYGLCGVVALFAKNKNTKLIISLMGNDVLGDHARNGKSTMFGNLLVCINRLCAKYADYIIVKNQTMACKIKHNNLSVIPNGLDLNLFCYKDKSFAMSEIGWDKKFIHLLFMSDPGRPEKNFKLSETAIFQLENSNYQVHFLKNVPHEEVVNYFSAADVCLLSSYHEGSPNVIKEAMACNCPVVTTDVGDIRWLFGDTQGYFITGFDPIEFSNKIILAAKFRCQYGQTNGRERIIELGLDSETIASKIIKVYNKVLNLKS